MVRRTAYMRVTLAIALMASIVFSACSRPEPIKLGFAGGVTGKNSSVAISARDAILLAVEEVNQKGGLLGRPVELVIKDDFDSDEGTIAADHALIDEGISIIFGHYMSQVAEASLEAIKGKDVLMVSPTISTYVLSGKDDQFIRLIVENTQQGKAMADEATAEGKKKALVLYNDMNQEFIQGLVRSFKDSFADKGGIVVGERMIAERDLDSMENAISMAKTEGVDAIMMVMGSGDVAMFAQLLSRQGMKPGLYSATWGMTADVIREGGETVEGVHFPALFNPEGTSNAFTSFKEAYRTAYSTDPDFAAVYAYEAAQVVFQSIESSRSTSAADVKAAIIGQKKFEGLQGEIIFDGNGDVKRPQFIVTIENGRFVTVNR